MPAPFDTDQVAREKALDPSQSFIVQAPAGSGKTSLLTMRFLVLLANAVAPEECLAITFTKKAANEMRERLVHALYSAKENQETDNPYEQKLQKLAKKVLNRDRKGQWNILENPNRLKIQTIDSLCASLTRQLPILTHFGAAPNIIEDARVLYLKAAENLLDTLEHETYWVESLSILLKHLDNNIDLTKNLLSNMLAYRDQWLPHIGKVHEEEGARLLLEKGLQCVIQDNLQSFQESVPQQFQIALLELLEFAANNVMKAGVDSVISSCAGLKGKWPKMTSNSFHQWLGIVELLTTKEGEWRQQITVNQGFPPISTATTKEEKVLLQDMKDQMKEILLELSQYPDLLLKCKKIRLLPREKYEEIQWEVVRALITLLPVLVAHLRLVFQEVGTVDFTEIAMASSKALGEAENPTDLALALEYKLHHILVDEFQDTSISQFRLLEKLTATWTPGDGRTLFLVGDPMQSIYRFRQAEVGLFLSVKNKGRLGNVAMHYLCLTKNFRSSAKLVTWCNTHFCHTFPFENDVATGAISFVPSEGVVESNEKTTIALHPIWGNDWQAEANQVVHLIQEEKREHPKRSIAVLVRSRSHVQNIIAKLREANIPYQGIEIESLLYSQTIQDLLSLTRALLCLSDRVAWLSLLRTPWINLPLSDLHVIANQVPNAPLWSLLENLPKNMMFSEKGLALLERVITILRASLAKRYRYNLRDWVFQTWTDLEGPSHVSKSHVSDVQVFFELLEKHERETEGFWDSAQLEESARHLYSTPTVNDEQAVQIMTIHKAKGLEFDTVILPGLGRRTLSETEKLLLWYEHLSPSGQSHLIFAPIKSQGGEIDPIYTYLKKEEYYRDQLESMRLLYVAFTRAKFGLHLIGHVPIVEDKTHIKPLSNSLLSLLWKPIASSFIERMEELNLFLDKGSTSLLNLPLSQ